MATYHLRLLVNPNVFKEVLHEEAYIIVKASQEAKAWDKNGNLKGVFKAISVDCRTYAELEWAANSLIEELKVIKKQAKIFFEKQKEKKKQYRLRMHKI
jgi:hypothetical protein